MKINFDQEIKNLDKECIKDGDKNLTLATVCVNALLAVDPKNIANVDGKEKVVRYELARRIHRGGTVDLTTDEISKVKKLVGKQYFPVVVGPVWDMLEKKTHELVEENPRLETEKEVPEVDSD